MKFVASFLPCLYDFLDFQDDKKMIRYRDGKIVSTKGERYTQVTKAESDEMKKSYVNNSWQLLKFLAILTSVRWQLLT